jgi:hypothetical protein
VENIEDTTMVIMVIMESTESMESTINVLQGSIKFDLSLIE